MAWRCELIGSFTAEGAERRKGENAGELAFVGAHGCAPQIQGPSGEGAPPCAPTTAGGSI